MSTWVPLPAGYCRPTGAKSTTTILRRFTKRKTKRERRHVCSGFPSECRVRPARCIARRRLSAYHPKFSSYNPMLVSSPESLPHVRLHRDSDPHDHHLQPERRPRSTSGDSDGRRRVSRVAHGFEDHLGAHADRLDERTEDVSAA